MKIQISEEEGCLKKDEEETKEIWKRKREHEKQWDRTREQQMSDFGFHCFAPDWIGFGFSDKPQPGYGYVYTEEEYHQEFDNLLDVLKIESSFVLVAQGFLVGSYALTWALKNKDKVSKLVILNTPLSKSSPLPGLFQQLRFSLLGEFTSQNAIMAERFIEAALNGFSAEPACFCSPLNMSLPMDLKLLLMCARFLEKVLQNLSDL